MSNPANSSGPVVFVTQVPTRRDRETGALTPTVNIGPAGAHGKIEVMMPAQAAFYNPVDLVRDLRFKLKPYDFDRGDSLLALGDPAILAVAGSVLAQWVIKYRILKWDRQIGRYNAVEIRL